ncbi:MAG: hypothetical protein ACI90V_013975, partial [Bacillariaceae sp.]
QVKLLIIFGNEFLYSADTPLHLHTKKTGCFTSK